MRQILLPALLILFSASCSAQIGVRGDSITIGWDHCLCDVNGNREKSVYFEVYMGVVGDSLRFVGKTQPYEEVPKDGFEYTIRMPDDTLRHYVGVLAVDAAGNKSTMTVSSWWVYRDVSEPKKVKVIWIK